jgi:glycosyltransferase involved in cell wall biosynthesis
MTLRTSLVVTTINQPTRAMHALASGCAAAGYTFFVIGDSKSPTDFDVEGARYLTVSQQIDTGLTFAAECPTGHYARKNVGYLLAVAVGTDVIVDTDDDNIPLEDFWKPRARRVTVKAAIDRGWVNAYQYFSDQHIWPRGFPLEKVSDTAPWRDELVTIELDCPIQQGLADGDPDVDAIYRMLLPLPFHFKRQGEVALAHGSWCPFNSQNTRWWRPAFPLMYLPSYCSFRMTDIWRSLVAQRIAWVNDWSVLFHGATVFQERNVHNLLKDFEQEIPGYLNNQRIVDCLTHLPVTRGADRVGTNLRMCYQALVDLGLIGRSELSLVDCWLADLARLTASYE